MGQVIILFLFLLTVHSGTSLIVFHCVHNWGGLESWASKNPANEMLLASLLLVSLRLGGCPRGYWQLALWPRLLAN
jgi:hypothetical protein